MSVQRKHTDLPPRYDVNDFTTEQRRRFTAVANAAQKRRDLYKRVLDNELVGKLSQQTCKPNEAPHQGKTRRASQVIWLVVILLVGLWATYWFAY
ncbi:hypothetical protein [Vibrio natriegens]|jgi:hypothetical protein|uniref:Uncharacterized protein n=1 Tax=Vibrio natriegens NBRC 15636 = ATCC 14048 = DSM 759 TaxID=1219067 RepID=A0AAN0Y6U5_VIBNA|nr:hypothetical protein [Vibrio natriegens]ALR17582.1 hypothetical protein PN96_16470 [Vibrio natriegens NBRC 15636 = ATCC 14048 = DSM 759]ANQ15072.1 hypothetical protein BA890_20315 [Vibrio natriegens NBRC 15636 = ATCC 14048 = DSM 759]EPM40067.1 hypothetical protein M272_14845 [Vibrio natriegens NBRC 15636 = ATCC 14048 = DSM 759]MDX6029592.1 hypothetical protein [Vibrio natriegens NBRC 15636 = ATCC 14048 = DSM 759]UUI14813.1 hypothetical protein NP431_22120 [Vibrio natriegens]